MRAEFRKIKDRGSWKYVTQAGCSFYYETTGMCETEPPDYVRNAAWLGVEAANLGRNIQAERKRRRTPTTGSSDSRREACARRRTLPEDDPSPSWTVVAQGPARATALRRGRGSRRWTEVNASLVGVRPRRREVANGWARVSI